MRMSGPAVALLAVALAAGSALARTTLVLESWRDDDRAVWQEKIIPAFEAAHPGIHVRFEPTAPTEYDAALDARLEAGTAGDLIACRPFDVSRALYEEGRLAGLDDLSGMAHFPESAASPWRTADGSAAFCVPVASVIHGFLYNRDAFRELDLEEPRTEAAFFAALERLLEDGTRVPMALGLQDRWEAATMGYNNIGPVYWRGEEGRRALASGRQRLSDEPWVAPFRALATWRRYLGEGYETQSYRESRDLFALGRAAVYPSGSWEIAGFRARAGFDIGAFRPPVREAGDPCYISDHADMAIGMNAASARAEAARVFLNWVASAEFAALYARALPGFFPLSDHAVEIDDPLARTFLSWREECGSTVRFASELGPGLERLSWDAAVAAIRGTATAEALGALLQNELGPPQ